MPQCPHCMSDIHEDAIICASCGAKKGISKGGMSRGDLQFRAIVVAAIAVMPLIGALVFFLNDDNIGASFMLVLGLPPLGLAGYLYLTSGGTPKWYR